MIKSTLCALPVYGMISLDLPVKTVDAIEKICRGFLWKGKKDVKVGHCLSGVEFGLLAEKTWWLGDPKFKTAQHGPKSSFVLASVD